jgi:orotidine-5'-phosphate decarboxylase
LRLAYPDMPFLVPGVGAQGGDVAKASRAAANLDGRGFIVNSSRAIIYASNDRAKFARAAGEACDKLCLEIVAALAVSA